MEDHKNKVFKSDGAVTVRIRETQVSLRGTSDTWLQENAGTGRPVYSDVSERLHARREPSLFNPIPQGRVTLPPTVRTCSS